MSVKKESDIELNNIANSFLVDIIYNTIKEFNIDYNELCSIFKEMDFIDTINDTETMVVGAHYGLDNIMQRIREAIIQ